jgi:ubiquinone/menaquinone biosynthesis C-methylase UbiE
MTGEGKTPQNVLDFWNSRAGLGQWAGTRDLPLKQLEMETLAQYVRDGMRILEVGCGNGITAIELAKRYEVDIIGIDYAEEMISAASDMLAGQNLKGRVSFRTGDVRNMSEWSKRFDLIYTERVLINLEDWPQQRAAIASITDLLADGGLYVMCEHSQDGLDEINALRERVGLARITPPWHNRYLRDEELGGVELPGVKLEGVNFFSSTYYFLSRVVNAWLAAQEGEEPSYDAPVNKLALQLPAVGTLGQGRIWLWRKAHSDA